MYRQNIVSATVFEFLEIIGIYFIVKAGILCIAVVIISVALISQVVALLQIWGRRLQVLAWISSFFISFETV